MGESLSLILPFVSVLLGAWITYALNVRQRRRTKVEDIFHDAIAAVGLAQASQHHMTNMNPWAGATAEAVAEFNADLDREGKRNHARAVSDARSALARAAAYDETLKPYLDEFNAVYKRSDEIMDHLRRNIDARG